MLQDLTEPFSSKKAKEADKKTHTDILSYTDFSEYIAYLGEQEGMDYKNILSRMMRIFYDDKKVIKAVQGKELTDDTAKAITALLLYLVESVTASAEHATAVKKELANLKMDMLLYNADCCEC